MIARVWYGILFRPAPDATPECPALPGWAENVLDLGGDITPVLQDKGYAGDKLTWIRYFGGESASIGRPYYGAALTDSIQDTSTWREINSACMHCYPDEVAGLWYGSLVVLTGILRVDIAKSAWYLTVGSAE